MMWAYSLIVVLGCGVVHKERIVGSCKCTHTCIFRFSLDLYVEIVHIPRLRRTYLLQETKNIFGIMMAYHIPPLRKHMGKAEISLAIPK